MTLAKEAAPLLRPLITTKGMTAAVQASTLGKPVKIVKVGLTARPGTATVADVALPDAVLVSVADGRLVNDHQVNISALLTDTFPTMNIAGIAFYLEDGTMFAVYREMTPFLEHTTGTTLLVGMDLVMDNIPSDSVIVESTGANLILGDWVPVFRRVNGRALTADIMLTAADVNAAPSGFGIGGDGGNLPDADCNKAVANGMYRVQGSAANTPYGQGPSGSRLVVTCWNKDYVSQIFFRASTNEMWTRGTVITNGVTTWRDWTQVYTTEFKPTVDLSGYVPTTRKVNNKALSSDINLTPEDIKAAPASHSHSSYVENTRKVNGKPLSADVTLNHSDVKAAPEGYGLGVSGVRPPDDDLNLAVANGFYSVFANTLNTPGNASMSGSKVLVVSWSSQHVTQILYRVASNRTYTRATSIVNGEAVWGDWAELYSQANKPTASDVGAYPVTGGEVGGRVSIKGPSGVDGLSLQVAPTSAGTNAVGCSFYKTMGDQNRMGGYGVYYSNNVPQFAYFGYGVQPWFDGLRLLDSNTAMLGTNYLFHTNNPPTPDQVGTYSKATIDAALTGQTPAMASAIPGSMDLNTFLSAGIWYQGNNAQAISGSNYPTPQAGILLVYKTAGVRQEYHVYGQNLSYTRAFYDGKWTNWSRIYNTATPPTSAEVKAVSLSGNDLKSGQLILQHASLPVVLRATATGYSQPTYMLGQDSEGNSRWYIGQANANNPNAAFHCYSTGTTLQLTDGEVLASKPLKDNSGTTFTTGRLPTAAQSTSDIRGGAYNAVGSYVLAALIPTGGKTSHGGYVPGSNLRPCSCAEWGYAGYSLPGTWMCMGDIMGANEDDRYDDRATLWIRTS
ncbi:tail fiber protein [Aeromonas phage 13AhydR10PP]|nr:tail fiber protein [Aeromonas phage 13AhydR10PP]